jgi:hypothetical protein
MNYDEETLKKAYRLHQSLMINGEIQKKKDTELYRLYSDPDIREVLNRIFLPIDDAIVVKADETLYFVPNIDNDAFSYTNEELRILMKLKDNKELYFAQFIWINVISEFYGEQYLLTGETRSFLKVDDILNKVKEHIGKFEKLPEDERNELSLEYQLDIPGMIEVWHSLSEVTDKLKDVSRAHTKNYGFFLKVLNFWESEKLLVVKEKEEIVMTEKMKNIIGHYYHQETRINEIKKLLNELD